MTIEMGITICISTMDVTYFSENIIHNHFSFVVTKCVFVSELYDRFIESGMYYSYLINYVISYHAYI